MKGKPKVIAKAVSFCIKTIVKHSPFWSVALVLVALISSFSVLVNVRVLENMINKLSGGLMSLEVYTLIIIWIIVTTWA